MPPLIAIDIPNSLIDAAGSALFPDFTQKLRAHEPLAYQVWKDIGDWCYAHVGAYPRKDRQTQACLDIGGRIDDGLFAAHVTDAIRPLGDVPAAPDAEPAGLSQGSLF